MELASPTIDPTAWLAPTAQLHGAITVEASAVIMFGVVMRAEIEHIRICFESNVQDNVVMHTDAGLPCIIGDRVTVGHAAIVHGATVGDHCLVGIGALVLNGSEMGEGSWIAAGSLLPEGKSIPPWTLAVGTPARPIRELTEDEIRRQREGVENYQDFAALYRDVVGG